MTTARGFRGGERGDQRSRVNKGLRDLRAVQLLKTPVPESHVQTSSENEETKKKKQGDQLFDNTCHPRDSAIVAVFGAARSGTLLMPGLRPRRASTRPLWDYSPFLEPGDVSMAHFMPSVPHTLSFLYLNLHLKHQILEQKWRLTGLF